MADQYYIIRKEKDCFIVFDNFLCTFFSLPITALESDTKIGEKSIISNLDLWQIYQGSKCTESSELSGPISYGIQVTNRCNLNCNYCISKIRSIEKPIDVLKFDRLIDFIQKTNPLSIWISGGEPTLNPNLTSLILLARKKLKKTGIALDTNGVNIQHTILDFLIDQDIYFRISLDSHIKEVHNYNRTCFEKTIKTINYLVAKNAKFGIMTVVNDANIRSLIDFTSFLSDKGIKRLTLLELRIGFSPQNIFIKNKEEVNLILNQVFEMNKKHRIFTTFISGKKKYSSLIIDPNGILFTSNPITGKKSEIINIFNSNDHLNWFQDSNTFDQNNHFSKYINILNNYHSECQQFIQ